MGPQTASTTQNSAAHEVVCLEQGGPTQPAGQIQPRTLVENIFACFLKMCDCLWPTKPNIFTLWLCMKKFASPSCGEWSPAWHRVTPLRKVSSFFLLLQIFLQGSSLPEHLMQTPCITKISCKGQSRPQREIRSEWKSVAVLWFTSFSRL